MNELQVYFVDDEDDMQGFRRVLQPMRHMPIQMHGGLLDIQLAMSIRLFIPQSS